MSPVTIIERQRRLRELARIRCGDQTQADNGKTRPRKLDRFRITSKDAAFVAAAAERYGGNPQEWTNPYDKSTQHEVYITADELPVVVPPTEMAFSQAFELWSAGGCQRRCDGAREMISDKECLCDPENRQCALTTRLSVILHELPGLGVSRLESHGYYAAVELAGAVEIVESAFKRGQLLPARLFLDPRTVKRPGPNGRTVTYKFVVPVLDFQLSFLDLAQLGGATAPAVEEAGDGRLAIAPPAAPFTPVPDQGPPPDDGSIADQLRAPVETGARGPHVPIKPTGRSPRKESGAGGATTDEAKGGVVPSSAAATRSGGPAASPAPDEPSEHGQGSLPLPQAIAMWCNDAGIATDEDRHRFLAAFSRVVGDGEYSSSKEVPVEHVPALRAALVRVKRGELRLDPTEAVLHSDAGPVAAGNTGMPVPTAGATDGEWDATRWRGVLKDVAGIGEAKLLRHARTVAQQLEVEPPKSLDEITDAHVVIQCLAWLKEQQT